VLRQTVAAGEAGTCRFATGGLAAGVYIVALERGGVTARGKLVLAR
jgi:hypothetical protein